MAEGDGNDGGFGQDGANNGVGGGPNGASSDPGVQAAQTAQAGYPPDTATLDSHLDTPTGAYLGPEQYGPPASLAGPTNFGPPDPDGALAYGAITANMSPSTPVAMAIGALAGSRAGLPGALVGAAAGLANNANSIANSPSGGYNPGSSNQGAVDSMSVGDNRGQ